MPVVRSVTVLNVLLHHWNIASYLRVIVSLVGGRICAEKVIVSLVVHIPDKHTLSLVQDDRDRSIIVSTVLVLSLNELQCKCK